MYIFHLNGQLNEDTGEIRFFFTCKGGKKHNSCFDIQKHRYMIECSLNQRKELFNCGISFPEICETAEWFFDRFGITVKPFYTVEEIGFTIEQKTDFYDQSKSEKVYFAKCSAGQFWKAIPGEITNYHARVSYQERSDFDAITGDIELENLFTFPFSADWWGEYFNFTIHDPDPIVKLPPKKRGPKTELERLLGFNINSPKRVRSN